MLVLATAFLVLAVVGFASGLTGGGIYAAVAGLGLLISMQITGAVNRRRRDK